MATSKTTVLGIRLDHERRGWIESEAARQGVSIRAYFERMIDEARSVRQDPEEPSEPFTQEPVHGVLSEVHDDIAAEPTRGAWSSDETDWAPEPPPVASRVTSTAPPGLCDDLASVAGIPCQMFREAMGLPHRLINVATRPFRRNRAF